MGINSGLPKYATYTAYNTETNVFVSADQAQHTITLNLDGAALGAPTNAITSIGHGVYEIELTDAERSGTDLVISGTSSTDNIIIIGQHYAADSRWNELLEDDGEGNLRNTAKSLESAAVADVSNLVTLSEITALLLAQEEHGDQTWSTADTSLLATQASVNEVLAVTNLFTFDLNDNVNANVLTWDSVELTGLQMIEDDGEGNTRWTAKALEEAPGGSVGMQDVNVVSWQGLDLSGTNMIEDGDTVPQWTVRALENAPAGSGSVSYVSQPTENRTGYLEILRGDTLDYSETLNLTLAFVTEIWYTIKRNKEDTDAEALLQISLTGGLLYAEGTASIEPSDASIEIEAVRSGVIRIITAAAVMAALPAVNRAYLDIQIESSGSIHTVFSRKVSLDADISRAVS